MYTVVHAFNVSFAYIFLFICTSLFTYYFWFLPYGFTSWAILLCYACMGYFPWVRGHPSTYTMRTAEWQLCVIFGSTCTAPHPAEVHSRHTSTHSRLSVVSIVGVQWSTSIYCATLSSKYFVFNQLFFSFYIFACYRPYHLFIPALFPKHVHNVCFSFFFFPIVLRASPARIM